MNDTLRDEVAKIISGAPFPSVRSYSKADQIITLIDREREAAYRAGQEAMRREAVKRTRTGVGHAMRESWDDICSDSGSHPLDITHGSGAVLWFQPNHWAEYIGNLLAHEIEAAAIEALTI